MSDFREFEKQSEILIKRFFLRKSCLDSFTIKVLLKNFLQRALFFNYAIRFSQVQTDIT